MHRDVHVLGKQCYRCSYLPSCETCRDQVVTLLCFCLFYSLCNLYNWRYKHLGNLPHVQQLPEFQVPNPGLTFDFQLINVEDFNGVGETEPNPYFYQVSCTCTCFTHKISSRLQWVCSTYIMWGKTFPEQTWDSTYTRYSPLPSLLQSFKVHGLAVCSCNPSLTLLSLQLAQSSQHRPVSLPFTAGVRLCFIMTLLSHSRPCVGGNDRGVKKNVYFGTKPAQELKRCCLIYCGNIL